jgi:hypothetical protein
MIHPCPTCGKDRCGCSPQNLRQEQPGRQLGGAVGAALAARIAAANRLPAPVRLGSLIDAVLLAIIYRNPHLWRTRPVRRFLAGLANRVNSRKDV